MDTPPVGRVMELEPLVRRVLAGNSGPFTYTGTQTYIVGRGEVAVIDPGPDDPEHVQALIEAVAGERVAAGQALSDPVLRQRAAQRIRRGPEEDERLRHLTPQERRILDLLADGLTNRQIADEMYLAEKTIKNYVSNLLAKMGMSRRTEAAVFAARLAERQHR